MAKKAPNPIDKHVGSRVRMRRMMLSMSQEKLGNALSLTFQQVQKYEKGTNRIGASRLQQIAQILQVPVSFFFEGAPHAGLAISGMSEAPSPAYVADFLATSDGLVAYQGIYAHQSSKLRRRIVDLVEQIAGMGKLSDCLRRVAAMPIVNEASPGARTAAQRILTVGSGRRCKNLGPRSQHGRGAQPQSTRRSVQRWLTPIFCSPASRFPKVTPDKVSDQISDAILDAFIEKDIKLGIADDSQINTRLGCETSAPPIKS